MKSKIVGAIAAVAMPALGMAQTTNCMVNGALVQCNSPTQATNCMRVGNTVQCNSTNMGLQPPAPPPPPRDDSAYRYREDAEGNFGAALGEAIARARQRAYERQMQNRQLAEQALQRGDCPTARTMAAKDKDMLKYVESSCASMATRGSEAQAQAQATADVQAFAADPRHPYFQRVRGQIGDLLRSGRAHTLQEAYDQAVAANPDLTAGSAPAIGAAPGQ